MDDISLRFTSRLDYLHLATALSREVCKTLNNPRVDERFVNEVELAVSEACTNAIKHSGDADLPKNIILSFQVHRDRLVINVMDQGPGFDMDKVTLPKFEDYSESGRGLYIIKSIMTSVRYLRDKGRNTLSMEKYFNQDNQENKS